MSVVDSVVAAVPTLHILADPIVGVRGDRAHHVVGSDGSLRGVFWLDGDGGFVRGRIIGPHGDVHGAVSLEGFCVLLLTGETLR